MRSTLLNELTRLDLALAKSLVGFMNGDTSKAAFDWVPRQLSSLAKEAGIPYKAEEFPDLTPRSPLPPVRASEFRWDAKTAAHFRESSCRWNAIAAVHFIDSVASSSNPAGLGAQDFRSVRTYLSEQLAPFQLITVWRVGDDGTLDETSIPRLDTVERCVAYVLGLMLLDRHHLRRGIKPCRKQDKMQTAIFFHFFLDLPNSKRLYCSEKHAATDRKRRERAVPRARKAK